MTTAEARPVLPTDILALVSYNGRSYPNEAWTRERLGAAEAASRPLGVALDRLLAFARGRSAWISVRRQRLQGLVAARPRGGKQAWEIDYLVDATAHRDAVPGLLDCAVNEVGRSGGEKLFLRVASQSDLLPVVCECGFVAYQEEALYARVGAGGGASDGALRAMTPADSYPAFRLYNATTPESVRRNEAATFNEWHASQERYWLRHGVQLVSEHEGAIDALVRAARLAQGVALDLTLQPEASARTPDLVRGAVDVVEGTGLPIFVLARKDSAVISRLESGGFDLQGEYVSLVRRTTRPVAMPKMVPAIAKNAVGV